MLDVFKSFVSRTDGPNRERLENSKMTTRSEVSQTVENKKPVTEHKGKKWGVL